MSTQYFQMPDEGFVRCPVCLAPMCILKAKRLAGRTAARALALALGHGLSETWCGGNCRPWAETEEGRALHTALELRRQNPQPPPSLEPGVVVEIVGMRL